MTTGLPPGDGSRVNSELSGGFATGQTGPLTCEANEDSEIGRLGHSGTPPRDGRDVMGANQEEAKVSVHDILP